MANKIEDAVVVVKNVISILSDEGNVKRRCEEIAKDNEGFVSLIQIHRSISDYVKLADAVKDNEFNQLENIGVIRGILADNQSWVGKKFNFKEDLKEKIYAFYMEAKVVLGYLENEERESLSDIEISFTYRGSTWTYGELWALEEAEAITNYSDIQIAENDTYLHKDNIEECIKKHSLSEIQDTFDAIEEADFDSFDRDDIREFLSEYDCSTIQQLASDFHFYQDMDAFEEQVVDEIVLQGIDSDIVRNCFDYQKYWNSYARYQYTELSNGTIAENF